jgi:urea transport system permease protein
MPEGWLFALGALFVLVTLFLPKGLVGWFQKFKRSNSDTDNAKTEEGTRA